MFHAEAIGTDGNLYEMVAGSRIAALHALAAIVPVGVAILSHTVKTWR